MADFLLIHINNQFDITQVITYNKVHNKAHEIGLEQLSTELKSKPYVLLLVPASWVYITTTHVPSRSSEILQKSIPFSIEDELINDVADNYYAWQIRSDQQQQVAVINKRKRHQINDFIKRQQLSLTGLYSEAVFCPAQEDCLSLWQDEQHVILRFGLDSSMVTSREQVPDLIQAFGQSCQEAMTNQVDLLQSHDFKKVHPIDLSDCCSYLIADNEVNLYRGLDQDNEHDDTSTNDNKIIWAAGFLLMSWLVIHLYQWWHLSSDIQEITSQQTQLLTEKFGEVSDTERRDPFAAMQSRLKQMNAQQQPNNILLDGIYYLGEARSKHMNIEIKGIRLFDNEMEIQVNAPAISHINSYRQTLQSLATDYRINIGVNELSEDVYQSVLTMKPR